MSLSIVVVMSPSLSIGWFPDFGGLPEPATGLFLCWLPSAQGFAVGEKQGARYGGGGGQKKKRKDGFKSSKRARKGRQGKLQKECPLGLSLTL